jgi:hypothetical protein
LTVAVAGGAIDIDEEMPSLTPNIEPQTGNMALTSENLKSYLALPYQLVRSYLSIAIRYYEFMNICIPYTYMHVTL